MTKRESRKGRKGQGGWKEERKKGRRENESRCEQGRDFGFVGYVVPVPMTLAALATPGPVIVPHSPLLSEVTEGRCNLTAMLLRGSSIVSRREGPQAGLWSRG